jgi:glycosyltransferase involved in cell wall biosynthesis
MRIYLNFSPRSGPYGGANSFLRTLMRDLERRGVSFTTDADEPVDVALINALTGAIEVADVARIAGRGTPIVHRKTGYRGRGSDEYRAEVDGVIVGDRLQIELSEYVAHSIFQSEYSRDVFVASGFSGNYSVIPNGVDEGIFNMVERPRFRPPRARRMWSPPAPLELIVSSWSTDPSKGFAEYLRIDEALRGRGDVGLTLVGRTPPGVQFGAARSHRPVSSPKLAALLKTRHIVLQLTQWESCSNALIEGLNCGLPAIYLESGANPEVAEPYGVPYRGDIADAIERVRERYDKVVEELPDNPYRISLIGQRYLDVLEAVAARRAPDGCGRAGGQF